VLIAMSAIAVARVTGGRWKAGAVRGRAIVVKFALSAILPVLFGASSVAAPLASPPRLAPARYASDKYGLTFRVPARATYCPLPSEWTGSDHGTSVFLEAPRRCDGAGYPSSSRGFEPESVARIELYYAYWMGEDELPEGPCRRVGSILFLSVRHQVCEQRKSGFVVRRVKARYSADIEAKAVLTLVTRPERLKGDMKTFTTAAASLRTCKSIWHGSKGRFTIGHGPLCPRSARWF
jgi:hypothetical protein